MDATIKVIQEVIMYFRNNLQQNEHVCAEPVAHQLCTMQGQTTVSVIAGALHDVYVCYPLNKVVDEHAHFLMQPHVVNAVKAIQRNDIERNHIDVAIQEIQHRQMSRKWAQQGRPVIRVR
jgi:LytS/YehU family sensor histidine kinase